MTINNILSNLNEEEIELKLNIIHFVLHPNGVIGGKERSRISLFKKNY
ncbi:MAG: hypothetical protein ACFFC3_03910 [Candidatus Odinarchaeota archaeon]